MSNAYYIIDNPLPLSQDFRSLKKEGLAYIQQISGNSWTNLNPSDPGVTILDQVCYALTELGYCNDFPVSDILTGPDGKLQIRDQFYLPGEILTTSPVTIADYIRSLVDNVNGVDNAVILSVSDTKEFKNGIYKVYLLLNPLVDAEEADNICKAAFYHLNDCRNLGELFLRPQILHPCYNEITGSITIDKKENANKILAAIQNELRNFIFPAAVPASYKQLIKEGFEMNEIFNGPVMKNGWIPADRIGAKKDEVKSHDLINVIKSVVGVEAVSELGFTSASDNSNAPLSSSLNQIIEIDLLKSIGKGTLAVNYLKKEVKLGRNVKSSLQLINSQKPELQVVLGDAGNVQADVPHGKFRDISSYYSIQNTFPEIFGIGPDSLNTGATEYEIAQSRQLKGYLTLFDQIIANQFSQLANINRLFSFKNAMTGAPANEHEYFAKMDSSEKDKPEYPVPYESFSPTYFYQALYNVSHIKPLLKDHDIFDYSDEVLPHKELRHDSWKKYQNYPYNSYWRGLTEFMENESINLERRNNILNHLLARHGESPLVVDAVLDGSVYSGESLKDQVIFKSLYLQNLGLLSYYRQKACNFTGANKLSAVIPQPPDNDQNVPDDFVDFIFDSSKINQIEKLHKSNFREYSALELKLNLLFGLKALYRNYLANHSEELTGIERQRLALWLVRERKGFILIETALLRQYQLIAENAENGQTSRTIPVVDNGIELIFPDFIAEFNDDFKKRLNFFLENSCPLHVPYKVHFVDCSRLKKLISVFVSWHNSLIEYSNGHQQLAGSTSENLMDMMIEINSVS